MDVIQLTKETKNSSESAVCEPQNTLSANEMESAAQQSLRDQVLRMRAITLWCSGPFVIGLMASMTGMHIWRGYLSCSLIFALLASIPLCVPMYRLVKRVHGTGYAIAHVFFLLVLTPAFLAGPVLLPLLVNGDSVRLLEDDSPRA